MLIQLIRCEKMKCKGTLIWPAFFLIPVIPVLLGCVVFSLDPDQPVLL